MQIFGPRANTVVQLSILTFILGIVGGGALLFGEKWSAYESEVQVAMEQPVPFSHKHHVSGIGLDCRYCHTSVESSAHASLPSAQVCMSCHSQIWQNSPLLAPVRESFAKGTPIQWNRVHRLPRFVYFDHSIHVNQGVGCASCHGQVELMPMTWKERTFYMRDCLECHRTQQQPRLTDCVTCHR